MSELNQIDHKFKELDQPEYMSSIDNAYCGPGEQKKGLDDPDKVEVKPYHQGQFQIDSRTLNNNNQGLP